MSNSGSSPGNPGEHRPPAWSVWLAAGAAAVAIVGGVLDIPSQVKSLFTESSTADADTIPPEEEPPIAAGSGPRRTVYTVNSPSPTAALNSIRDNPAYGDERNFTQCRDLVEAGHNFRQDVAVSRDSQIEVYVYLGNASTTPGEDVIQTSMRAVLPNKPSGDPVLQVKFTGRSATSGEAIEVWDGCQIMSDKPVKLSYLAGSTQVFTKDHPEGMKISDEVVRGEALIPGAEGHPDGYVPANTSNYGYFTFTLFAVLV